MLEIFMKIVGTVLVVSALLAIYFSERGFRSATKITVTTVIMSMVILFLVAIWMC